MTDEQTAENEYVGDTSTDNTPDTPGYTRQCRRTEFYYKCAPDQEWQKGTCEICTASGHIDAIAPHILRGIRDEDGIMVSSFIELRDPQLLKRLAQFVYDQREEYVADASLLMFTSHDEISGFDFRAANKILDIVRGTEQWQQ